MKAKKTTSNFLLSAKMRNFAAYFNKNTLYAKQIVICKL